MELFERVREISKQVAKSQTELALGLNLSQSKFNGYLKKSSQNNLWPLLPKILALYPTISRDWLFFDEGEMLAKEKNTIDQPSEKEALLAEENLRLTKKVETLQDELSRAKDEIISLYKAQEKGQKTSLPAPTEHIAAQ